MLSINEAFGNYYRASEDEFRDIYHPYILKPEGDSTTHVYNKLGDKIATYNHEMGVLSTNRLHDDLKKI